MIKKIKKFLIDNSLIGEEVIVGYSAGPDSTALALALSKLNIPMILAYFNHGWRREAELEEEFTKDFAKKIGAKYYIAKASKVIKTEEAARAARYEFFEECVREFSCNRVLLAHNKNDNIETLIYRIIKGTGIRGLCSIPELRPPYYRPMLDVTKDEILEFLKTNNQNYMIDSSNNDTKYKRNLIRKKILPLFSEINPNYINSIDNLIKNAILSKSIIDEVVDDIEFKKRDKYLSYSSAIRYELLNKHIGEKLKNRDSKNIKKIDDFILNNTNSKLSLNDSEFLKVKNNDIYIEKLTPKSELELTIAGEGEYDFEDVTLKIEKTKTNSFKSNNNTCFLELDFPLTLRHRKPGDIFSPYGLKNGKMKLKDFLINEKIEQSKKDKLVLLCKNSEVCWVLGVKISEKYKAKNNYYKLTLEYKNERH